MSGLIRPLPVARKQRLVWVIWLTRLLAGVNKCEWPLWALSRHKFPQEEDTPEDIERRRLHESIVQERVRKLRQENLYCSLAEDNFMFCEGDSGIQLRGIPDIKIPERGRTTYEDCKGAEPGFEHHIQVLLYVQIARQKDASARESSGLSIDREYAGNVVYRDHLEAVDLTLSTEIAQDFAALMGRINADTVPRVPSAFECRWCKVREYCDERVGRV